MRVAQALHLPRRANNLTRLRITIQRKDFSLRPRPRHGRRKLTATTTDLKNSPPVEVDSTQLIVARSKHWKIRLPIMRTGGQKASRLRIQRVPVLDGMHCELRRHVTDIILHRTCLPSQDNGGSRLN